MESMATVSSDEFTILIPCTLSDQQFSLFCNAINDFMMCQFFSYMICFIQNEHSDEHYPLYMFVSVLLTI